MKEHRSWERWKAYLQEPEDAASLGVFRILFGSVMLWEVCRYALGHRIGRYYVEPVFYFSYIPGIQPWPGYGMYIHFVLLGILSVLLIAGIFYRYVAILFCIAFTYVFLLDKSQYLNHLYLVCLLSFLFALFPLNRAFSLDRKLFFPSEPETSPRYARLALRLQFAIVYFFGAIAKINADWLSARPLDSWLLSRSHLPVLGPLFEYRTTALVFAWAGFLIDLSMGFLLFSRRTFWMGAVLAILFNSLNAYIFNIGIFPYVMMASLVLFAEPSGLRRALVRLGVEAGDPPEYKAQPPSKAGNAMVLFLHAYILVHLLLPLRHWLYADDVTWTEEGHRFSWRMKLRDKDACSYGMEITDPRTGHTHHVDPKSILLERQFDKMVVRPDMVVQFARYVADLKEKEMGVRPIVRVEIVASLNGGPFRYLINPKADLAAAEPEHLFENLEGGQCPEGYMRDSSGQGE